MQSHTGKPVFYYQTSASSLGGFLEKPFEMGIPSQASAVLPAVGGLASANTEAFNLHNIVSCSRASVRVVGRQTSHGFSIVATSVVEKLNILEVVTADAVIGQVAVEYTKGGRRFSFAGTRFEGLRLGGCVARLRLNDSLLAPQRSEDDDGRLSFDNIQSVGDSQDQQLKELIQQLRVRERERKTNALQATKETEKSTVESHQWAIERYKKLEDKKLEGKLPNAAKPGVDTYSLCSLVNRIDRVPGTSLGHILDIPDFGRIFLGEVLVSGTSIQVVMIRAELGCAVVGGVSVGVHTDGGHAVPPLTTN